MDWTLNGSIGKPSPVGVPRLVKMAAVSGEAVTIKDFLRKGGSPDVTDSDGRTLLRLAAEHGHLEICQLLLASGAEPGIPDRRGIDAVTAAKRSGKPGTAELIHRFMEQPSLEDGGDWIPEPEAVLVRGAQSDCFEKSAEVQSRISNHEFQDPSESWTDVDVHLPVARALEWWVEPPIPGVIQRPVPPLPGGRPPSLEFKPDSLPECIKVMASELGSLDAVAMRIGAQVEWVERWTEGLRPAHIFQERLRELWSSQDLARPAKAIPEPSVTRPPTLVFQPATIPECIQCLAAEMGGIGAVAQRLGAQAAWVEQWTRGLLPALAFQQKLRELWDLNGMH